MALQCTRTFLAVATLLLVLFSVVASHANGEAKAPHFSVASNYEGSGDGDVSLEIMWLDNDFLVAFATTSITARCFGFTSGIGRLDGRSLVVSNIWRLGGPTCTLQIEFDESGRKAVMNEEQGCSHFHGVSCGFGGTLVAPPSP